MRLTRPTSTTPTVPPDQPSELLRVAQEYADLFNASPLEDIDRLVADACVDPFWDDRTNLLSLLADGPEDLGLVLATDHDDYAVVRYVALVGPAIVDQERADNRRRSDRRQVAGEWIVDTSPIDWEELEDEAFDDGPDRFDH
jgi:hypothetical protein